MGCDFEEVIHFHLQAVAIVQQRQTDNKLQRDGSSQRLKFECRSSSSGVVKRPACGSSSLWNVQLVELPACGTSRFMTSYPTLSIPDTTMASPADRVFAVAELLEIILLDLPLRDILLAKGISRTVSNTIDGSSYIRKALWYEPLATPTTDQVKAMGPYQYQVDKADDPDSHSSAFPTGVPKSLALHPLLCDFIDVSIQASRIHGPVRERVTLTLAGGVFRPRAPGSWQDMLVVQPHASDIHVVRGRQYVESCSLAAGLTSGALVQLLREKPREKGKSMKWGREGTLRLGLMSGLGLCMGVSGKDAFGDPKGCEQDGDKITGWEVLGWRQDG